MVANLFCRGSLKLSHRKRLQRTKAGGPFRAAGLGMWQLAEHLLMQTRPFHLVQSGTSGMIPAKGATTPGKQPFFQFSSSLVYFRPRAVSLSSFLRSSGSF